MFFQASKIVLTTTKIVSSSFEKNAHRCHAFNFSKYYVQMSCFGLTGWGLLHLLLSYSCVRGDSTEWSYLQPTSKMLLSVDKNTSASARRWQHTSDIPKLCDFFCCSCSHRFIENRYTSYNASCWESHPADCKCCSAPAFSVSSKTTAMDPTSISA